MISALAWVSRGFPKHIPKEHEIEEEEKKVYTQEIEEVKK